MNRIGTQKISSLLLLLFLPVVGFAGEELVSAKPEAIGLSAERLERIGPVLQGYVDREEIAGIVALVARDGKIGYLQTFGFKDRQKAEPMGTDTLFRIASMTKAITCVAVMMLYEEGHFLLGDPISKYIPEFERPVVLLTGAGEGSGTGVGEEVPADREITIRDLLTHTSGITYRFFGKEPFHTLYEEAGISDGLIETEGTIGESVKRLAKLPLMNQPGAAWEYGLNMDVLGYLVEVVSGMTLDEFFRERIFRPLGMSDTYFFLPPEKVSRLASVYARAEEGGLKKYGDGPIAIGPVLFSVTYPYNGPRTYFSGGGGLTSSIMDYARFLQMLLNGGQFNGVRLLSRKTIELMTVNQIGDLPLSWDLLKGQRFGLGFAVSSGPEFTGEIGSAGEYSWGGFFHTKFWVDPKERLIGILMTQLYPSLEMDTGDKFRVLVYQAIED